MAHGSITLYIALLVGFGASNDQFVCNDESSINGYKFCDEGQEGDCPDKSDEIEYTNSTASPYNFGCKNIKWLSEKTCVMPLKDRCNGVSNCHNDECNCPVISNTSIFLCPPSSGGGCITSEFMCNGYKHCNGSEDEALCYNSFKCNNDPSIVQYVPKYRVCDGYYHCSDWSDENATVCEMLKFSRNYTEPRKYIHRCYQNKPDRRLPVNKVCDGQINCICEDKNTNCPDYGIDEKNCTESCANGQKIRPEWICDGYPHCGDASDECNRACNRSHMYTKAVHKGFFDSDPKYCLKFNTTECSGSTKPYRCDNGNCIKTLAVCNTLDKCGDWSDEEGCLGRFYCNNKQPRWVPFSDVCNGISDCFDGSDECNNCSFDILANDDNLIANPILGYLIWIQGILALTGNLILMLSKGHELKTRAQKMNSVTKISTLLLVNLAFSDFLMGLYLVGIATTAVRFKGSYCEQERKWRSGIGCHILGSLCLLSSECSILMMTLITLHRLVSVLMPQKIAVLGRRGLLAWYVVIFIIWVIVLIFAAVPNMNMFKDYFITEAYFEQNPYFGSGKRIHLQDYVQKYQKKLDPKHLSADTDQPTLSWDNILIGISNTGVGNAFHHRGLFGFYSAHGVCLPKLFTTVQDPSWTYSLFLNIFNTICFLFIVLAYSYILTVSKKMASKKKRGSTVMSRKITRLVVTDGCCWIPTCIIAYLFIAGVYIKDEVYAFTAILILPINSCLNPLLYTDVIDKVHVFLLKHLTKLPINYNSAIGTVKSDGHNELSIVNNIDKDTMPTTANSIRNGSISRNMPQNTGPSEVQSIGVRALPQNNIGISLISLFCFLSPVGLYATMLAWRSNQQAVIGNSVMARRFGEEAQKWSIIGMLSNGVLVVVCVLIYITFFRNTLDIKANY